MTWNKIVTAAAAAFVVVGAGAAGAAGGEYKTQEQAEQEQQQMGQPERVTVTQEPDQLPSEEQRTLTLTVTNVDRANNRVQFEAQVDPEARVMSGSEELRINQLQPGDSVRASFDPVTGEVQQMIVVERAAPEPGAQQPSPEQQGIEEPAESGSMGSEEIERF
ncbi:hypothetical protein [Vulgatibacter sp.]|uniref:hypothetical protein n=1 Tax=Vulgatibacter sp. TaxID=1971226 RepID=UPI003568CAEE